MSVDLQESRLVEELRPRLDEDAALLEATRCLECGGAYAEAPCVTACPAGVDVPSFIASIAEDDPDAAARTIFAANILGATCARVCPVEVLCQASCVLEHEGRRPVEIGALQRYATEWAFAHGTLPRVRAPRNGRRIAVLGAGPAGLAVAGELACRGYDVTVYDERAEIGGLVRFAIAPYRQLRDPLPDEQTLLEDLGVDIRLGHAIDSPEALHAIADEADAVVLAVGMGADSDVRYPGDELEGVWESLPFIEALKTGTPPEVGRRVAVVGGGNTAVDAAVEAVRLGADEVTMIYRRTEAEMPAYPHEVAQARHEGVGFQWLTVPVRFLGDGRLEGVECARMELGEPDASGRRRPVEVPGSEFVLPVDTVVKAIGQQPRSELLSWVEGLQLDHGLIAVDAESGATANPRFFAAGDAVNGGATVVEAVAAAKRAVLGIERLFA